MAKNKWTLSALSIVAAVMMGACNAEDAAPADTNEQMDHGDSHAGMDHSSSGEVPDGLEEAANPMYEVGSQAIIETDHMDGMMGAEAKISGAYDTTAYAVSYTPEGGGDPVQNHKWVIHEELENAPDAPFNAGDEVVLDADHMKGMDGAKATIDSAEQTTVYMVDFDMENGERIANHKWVTEDELSPAGN